MGMIDRGKVIKGLETIKQFFRYGLPSTAEMFDSYYGILNDAIAMLKEQNDAFEQMRLDNEDLRKCYAELLKEQEAKQVIKQTYHVMMNLDYENPVEVTRYDWLCPTCKSLLCRDIDVIDDNYHFCKVCGQAVKWMDEQKPKSTIEIIKDAGYVLVVRCDKCTMRDRTKMCHIWWKDVKDDDYCSYGKWKKGELDDHD